MRILLTILFLFGIGLTTSHAQSGPSDTKPQWQLIPAKSTATSRHLVLTVKRRSPELLSRMQKALERKYRIDVVAEWPLASIDVHCFVVRVKRFTSVSETINKLESDGDIRTVQSMKQFQTLATKRAYKDELFKLQTNLSDIDVVSTHQRVTGRNVKIAVIDTGVDLSHPDFVNQNIAGKDFVGVGVQKVPKERHGTAITGVIAASNANKEGIVGIAPNAEIIAMRGCWQNRLGGQGRCSTFSLARAINFAILQNVDIINMSLGGPRDPLLAELIEKAVKQHGILVVAAFGENANARFPATEPNVIGVSGKARGKRLIKAPDIDILSTAPGGKYDFYSGSSVATAHVSAVAALMLEADKSLSPRSIFRIIKKSSQKDQSSEFFNTCKIISSLKPLQCL